MGRRFCPLCGRLMLEIEAGWFCEHDNMGITEPVHKLGRDRYGKSG